MQGPSDGRWYYQQVDLGFNYRMTDLQAALGTSQMKRLPAFLLRRRDLASRYTQNLSHLPLVEPKQLADTLSAWHLYVIQVDPTRTLVSREALYEGLRARSIFAQVHYIPVHTQPWYRNLGFKSGDFPEAEAYYSRALSLPMYHDLSDTDQDRVIQALTEILEA
jgi:dTDP-4-amino-4,6-dideoxygalactose transaminase